VAPGGAWEARRLRSGYRWGLRRLSQTLDFMDVGRNWVCIAICFDGLAFGGHRLLRYVRRTDDSRHLGASAGNRAPEPSRYCGPQSPSEGAV
jgi:hypothetical protein